MHPNNNQQYDCETQPSFNPAERVIQRSQRSQANRTIATGSRVDSTASLPNTQDVVTSPTPAHEGIPASTVTSFATSGSSTVIENQYTEHPMPQATPFGVGDHERGFQ